MWLDFDIDRPDAYFAAEDGNVPPFNFVAVNPKNGHAHGVYLLAKPVHKFSAARRKPIDWAAAIERGIRRRLEADPAYSGISREEPVARRLARHLDAREALPPRGDRRRALPPRHAARSKAQSYRVEPRLRLLRRQPPMGISKRPRCCRCHLRP
jgi:hypothetical protein